jgi:hypothetical protein
MYVAHTSAKAANATRRSSAAVKAVSVRRFQSRVVATEQAHCNHTQHIPVSTAVVSNAVQQRLWRSRGSQRFSHAAWPAAAARTRRKLRLRTGSRGREVRKPMDSSAHHALLAQPYCCARFGAVTAAQRVRTRQDVVQRGASESMCSPAAMCTLAPDDTAKQLTTHPQPRTAAAQQQGVALQQPLRAQTTSATVCPVCPKRGAHQAQR